MTIRRQRVAATMIGLGFVLLALRPPGGLAQTPPSDAAENCIASVEPNDEPVDAQALPDGTACVTAEHDDAGQELFTWTVSAANATQRWTIATSSIPGQAITLQVYDGELNPDGIVVNQQPLAKSDGGPGQGASLNNLLWPAGDYLVGVATSGAGAYRLDIVPGDPVPDPDESEPNDAADTAEAVTGAFGVSGDRTDTEDWYAWEIPNASEDQLWRLAVQFPIGIPENVTLYGEDLTTLFDRTAGPDGRLVLDDIGLPGGRYLIAVPAAVEISGTYILEVSQGADAAPGGEREPNDTLAAAARIAPGEGGTTVTGRLATVSDVTDTDVYGFTVDQAISDRQMDLRLFWEDGPARDLCLLDSLEQELRCESGEGGIAFNDLVLPEGEYGISVSGVPDPDAPYLLRFDVTIEPVASFETEPNDAIAFANPLDPSGETPTIMGRLDGANADNFRLTVAGEPQLWRITATGAGVAKLDVLNAVGSVDATGTLLDGTATIEDVFLLPGDHYIAVQDDGVAGGQGQEYTVQAVPLGPPDPAAEREPNNGLDRSQPIRLGEERTGRLVDANDVDVYRFALQNAGRVIIGLEVPAETQVAMDLDWGAADVAKMTSAVPGDSLEYDALLPPGDYAIWLRPIVSGPDRYTLRIDPADPFTPPDDAEPNDDPAQARPLPPDGTVRGLLDPRLNDGRDVDIFVLPARAEAGTATLRIDGTVTVDLITPATPASPASPASPEFAETILPVTQARSDAEGRFEVDLPSDTPILVRVSGTGEYRVSLRPDDAGGGGLLGGLGGGSGDGGGIGIPGIPPLRVDLTLDDAPVAAYWPDGQRIDGEVTLANGGEEPLDLTLDAATGHHAWTVAFDVPELTLDSGETQTLPVTVHVAPDAWAGQPVLVTVRARTDATQRTASVAIVPDAAAPPLNSEPWSPLPPELLGGLNVAWEGLGGAAVNPLSVDTAVSESQLFNGVSPTGYAWEGDPFGVPIELTVDLAGDDPIPVAGITLLTLAPDGFRGEGLRGFDLELSLDGVTFEPALSGELDPLPTEQAFVLEQPMDASYARLRVRSATLATASVITISEWAVIAEPGWTLGDPDSDTGAGSSSDGDAPALLDLGASLSGGHVVEMQPQLGASLEFQGMLTEDGLLQTLTVEPGAPITWTVGFRDNRAAQIESLAWLDPPGSNPDVRFTEVEVEISTASPIGPWTSAGTWNLDRDDGTEPAFAFDEPTWARFIRLTGVTTDGGVPDSDRVTWELPDAIRVMERAPDDAYRSILGEWGLYSQAAIYERLVAPPAVTLDPDAGDTEADATALPLGATVNDTAWVGRDEDWYRVEAPDGENGLAFTLTGDPTVDVEVALFTEDGKDVPLDATAASPRETTYTAAAEPGEAYLLRVTEPPTTVMFAFDTSFSIGPYTTTVFQGLYRYAGDVRAGQEAANILPFGGAPLLDAWTEEPYVLQAAITNYPQTDTSSDAEGALITSLDGLRKREGTTAIVVITDAATTPSADEMLRLWPALAETAPRIFAVHITGGEAPLHEQQLMQDWAAVNNGAYTYVVTQGEMDVAFDRAAATLRRPSGYGLSVSPAEVAESTPEPTEPPEPTQTPEPTETPEPTATAEPTETPEPTQTPEPTATAEPTETPEPEPEPTAVAADGSIRVVAPPVGVGQPVPVAADASVALIFDTSGSMLQPLEGGTRADVAKAALIDLVTVTLPPGTDVSLRAFGVTPDSCETRLVVPQAPLDPAAMADTIQALEVVDLVRTPLGASLEAVAADLGTDPGPKIVVFVTDGEETCGGDSAAAIQALVDSGIDVRVNIVGFALDDAALKAQFEDWARIGNGRYIDAGNQAELTAAVAEAVLPVFTVVDESGRPVASGQVGGDAITLPPGTYTVEIMGSTRVRIGGIVVTSDEETVVGEAADDASRPGVLAGFAGVLVLGGLGGVRRRHRAAAALGQTEETLIAEGNSAAGPRRAHGGADRCVCLVSDQGDTGCNPFSGARF